MTPRTAALLFYIACLYIPATVYAALLAGRAVNRWSTRRMEQAVDATLDPRVARGLSLAAGPDIVAEAERITREAVP